jgi:hypothetical protein
MTPEQSPAISVGADNLVSKILRRSISIHNTLVEFLPFIVGELIWPYTAFSRTSYPRPCDAVIHNKEHIVYELLAGYRSAP